MNKQNFFDNHSHDLNEFDIVDPVRTSANGSFSFDVQTVYDFTEHDRSVDIQYTSVACARNEISMIPPDAVCFADHGLNSKYKSIAIAGGNSISHPFEESRFHSHDLYVATKPPKLSSEHNRLHSNVNIVRSTAENPTVTLRIPPKPFYVCHTNFLCFLTLFEIIERVEKVFNSIQEVSYQFIQQDCMWEAVYLRGSSYCKLQIHIFKEDDKSSIIEGNRLSGDGFPFRRIYDDIKNELNCKYDSENSACGGSASFPTSVCSEESRADSFSMNNYSGGINTPFFEPISDIQAAEAIKPIITMAKSNKIDSQFEASAIMCDLSLHEDMQQIMCDEGCVTVLMELLSCNGEFQNCNYHAICALANLSTSVACQELLVSTPLFLTSLLKLVSDGPYYSAELRRESARVLANISERNSSQILSAVDNDSMRSWINSVDDIKDERLRTHANRAKLSLSNMNAVY